MISQTYIAVAVSLLAYFLPKLGVQVGGEELTSIIESLVIAISGIWIIVRRYQKGDIYPVGVRK